MNDFIYYSPTKIYFGKYQEKNIGKIIAWYNYKNVLFVYGQNSIIKSGLFDTVRNSLENSNIKYHLLNDILPNPRLDKVEEGISICRKHLVDLILAVGGGSVIDTAKAISCGVYYDGNPWDINCHKVIPTKALPIGVILTISAAGSELSNSCVINNLDTKEKMGFNNDIIRPKFAILDPLLTLTVSKYQTACGIVDMFMHTAERFLNDVENNYFEEEVALGVLKSIVKATNILKKDPLDYNARATLMIASSFSHNGLTGLGANFYFTVHKLENEISGRFENITHAAGLSVLFIGWARYVYKLLPNKFQKLGETLFEIKEKDPFKASVLTIDSIENFFKELNMPVRFKELQIDESYFELMAKRLTANNTKKIPGFLELDKEMIIEIFNIVK